MALSVSRVYYRSLSFTLNRVLLGNHSFGPGSISHTGFHMFKAVRVLDHLHPQCLLMRGGWHHRALRSRRALSRGPPRSQHHAMQRTVEQRGGLTNTNPEQSPRSLYLYPFYWMFEGLIGSVVYFACSNSICIRMHLAQDSATQDWQVGWNAALPSWGFARPRSEQLCEVEPSSMLSAVAMLVEQHHFFAM